MIYWAAVATISSLLGFHRRIGRYQAWKERVLQDLQEVSEKEKAIEGYGTFAKSEKVGKKVLRCSTRIKPWHEDYGLLLLLLICVVFAVVDTNARPTRASSREAD